MHPHQHSTNCMKNCSFREMKYSFKVNRNSKCAKYNSFYCMHPVLGEIFHSRVYLIDVYLQGQRVGMEVGTITA